MEIRNCTGNGSVEDILSFANTVLSVSFEIIQDMIKEKHSVEISESDYIRCADKQLDLIERNIDCSDSIIRMGGLRAFDVQMGVYDLLIKEYRIWS